MTLAEINRLALSDWLERLGGVFEHSAWVAERTWKKRPFGSVDDLHAAMLDAVLQARPEEKLALVRAHPELAGAEAREGTLTADSSGEQGRLGFTALTKDEFVKMQEINRRYREKFGFPCIVALRLHAARAAVMAKMQRRLAGDAATELRNALEQIGHIARGRLEKLVHG